MLMIFGFACHAESPAPLSQVPSPAAHYIGRILATISRMISSLIMRELIDCLQPVQSPELVTCDDAVVGKQ
jgi:hypothetical protein